MTPDRVIQDFAKAGSHLPREAMQWSLDHWPEVAPAFLARLEAFADNTDRSKEAQDVLFFAIHLAGEARETRAFDALTRICRDGAALDDILGDGITTTLTGILIGTFDGRVESLQAVIEAEGADQFVRDTAVEAYSYLAAAGRIDLDEARTYLSGLYGTLLPQDNNYVWVGWQQAVARLGLVDLKDQVAEVFRREFIDVTIMDYEDFETDLESALRCGTPLDAFERERIGPIVDVIGQLGRWHGFSEEYRLSQQRLAGSPDWEDPDPPWSSPALPYVNPERHVGRNDPCPCGSGKKFKKCCLALAT